MKGLFLSSVLLIVIHCSSISAGEAEERALLQKNSRRCLGLGKKYGWCTHITRCPLPEFKTDRLRFMDYFCIIDRVYIGVCCPDSFLFQTQLSQPLIGGSSNDVLQPDTNEVPGGEVAPVKNDPKASGQSSTTQAPKTTTSSPLPERKGCGLNEKQQIFRVTGGRAADPKEWPWMAAIMRFPDIQFCGGTLITDRHILTAAHCIFRYKPQELFVRLGEHDFSRVDETRHQNINVSEIRKHRDFDEVTYENDIAILKISRAVTFNSYIWPICLPESGPLFTEKIAVVIGWGTVEYGGSVSDKLMEVGVPVWNNKACADMYVQPIEDTNLCAGGQVGKDSCQGDSGGPLLLQLENRRWVIIGVVSWGIHCGEERPAVYTRVTRYLDWIVLNTL